MSDKRIAMLAFSEASSNVKHSTGGVCKLYDTGTEERKREE